MQISKLRFFISLMVDQRVDDSRPNRNVLSLPNLETKFVAANTLIPVDKPQQLLLKDSDLEKTEKELHEIHHKIFFTRSYTDKKALKNKELATRRLLRKLYVEKAGYSKEAAEEITKWNPFDPLLTAPFFDPEVMFTLEKSKHGGYFDIVIGNPPYISALDLKKQLNEVDYLKLKKLYITAKGTVDIFIYFFERAINLNSTKGILTFISPNRYLSTSYGEALRKFLYNNSNIINIVDLSDIKVFEQTSVYPIITILVKIQNQKTYKIRIGKYEKKQDNIVSKIVLSDRLSFLEGYIWGYLLNDKIAITEKIIKKSVPITQACLINATSTASEAEEYHKLINEKNGYKLINTGTIDKYFSLWGTEKLIDKKLQFLYPYLPKKSRIISENRHKLYSSEKIILAKIGLSAEAFYDERGEYASINTNCCHSFKNDFTPRFVLAWINSRLFQYSFECFFEGLKMQGGYLLFSAPNISKMSIMKIPIEVQTLFNDITKEIEASKNSSNKELIDSIDLMFFKLYTLTFNECKIIDPEIEKFISREEYEKATIEELAEWELKK